MNKEPVVVMQNIQKKFGDITAVESGYIDVLKGEIHSLIGENGAGKSTMMKLLYGLYPIDDGKISILGEDIKTINPKKAISLGIGMVHQEFMLINELTVLENILLGFEPKKGLSIDFTEGRRRIEQFVTQYGLDIQLDKRINQISVGEAQRVEIVKCLSRGAEFIILDEPTAVLTPQETDSLFMVLRKLRSDGKSVIFISHKLDEVMEISDRITVMRQGKYINTIRKEEASQKLLAKMMIGRDLSLNIDKHIISLGDTVLDVQNLWVSGEKEISKIRDLSFSIQAGEILGVAGIDGNGQSELVEALTGLRKVEKGTISLCGKNITKLSVRRKRAEGITHIPEDRNSRGLNRALSIAENLIATNIDNAPYSRYTLLRQNQIKEDSKKLVQRFDIRPSDISLTASALSGGNAQKIVVAREVSHEGSLLIASQPTRGVDIGAIESIRSILEEEKEKGRAVLLVSADLEEILSLSDRIIVMYEGRITGSLQVSEATSERLGLLMMGKGEGLHD